MQFGAPQNQTEEQKQTQWEQTERDIVSDNKLWTHQSHMETSRRTPRSP